MGGGMSWPPAVGHLPAPHTHPPSLLTSWRVASHLRSLFLQQSVRGWKGEPQRPSHLAVYVPQPPQWQAHSEKEARAAGSGWVS